MRHASIQSLATQLARIEKRLTPPPKQETRLPYLVVEAQAVDGETVYADFPGYESHNQEHEMLTKRLALAHHGFVASVYVGFDPNDDGVEP